MTRSTDRFSALLLLMSLFLASPSYACAKHANAEACEQAQAAAKPTGYDGPKENLHVYLLIGQSNMAGRAEVTEDIAGVIDRCYLLNDKNEWVPAKNPLNLYSTIRKGEGMQKLGPGYSFALKMLEANPDISLGLVVNARGGSAIHQWQRDANYYLQATERTQAAIKTGTLKGILWHQGESDTKRQETYLDSLKALISNLRNDLGEKNLPFVAGQISNTPQMQMNDVIASLPEHVQHTAYASSKDLKTYDRWHFDTKSQITLGQRYAEAMLKLHAEAQADKEGGENGTKNGK